MEVDLNKPIGQIINDCPDTAEVMKAYGLGCVDCFASQYENLKDGAMTHQLSNEELDNLIRDLNRVINSK
jgi:hybrid cluster-associated redox disulfide protein